MRINKQKRRKWFRKHRRREISKQEIGYSSYTYKLLPESDLNNGIIPSIKESGITMGYEPKSNWAMIIPKGAYKQWVVHKMARIFYKKGQQQYKRLDPVKMIEYRQENKPTGLSMKIISPVQIKFSSTSEIKIIRQ